MAYFREKIFAVLINEMKENFFGSIVLIHAFFVADDTLQKIRK